MPTSIILLVIIILVLGGLVANKIIDAIFDKKPKQPQEQIIQDIPNAPIMKPEQVDVLIAIDKKLAKQNEHLATIRFYVGWLLAIAAIPVIVGILLLMTYGTLLSNLLNNL